MWKEGMNMDKLITTPYNFIWRIKNPQDYWADSFEEIKYIVIYLFNFDETTDEEIQEICDYLNEN